ncbi:MAG: SRPBCC family protein [Ginsengibacter sp.]
MSKSVRINAPGTVILAQINNFDNWRNWYPAFSDSQVIVSIQRGKSDVAELSDKDGRRILFKMLAISNTKIDIGLFIKEKSTTIYQFILLPSGTGTTEVTLNVTTNLAWYPWKKIQGIVLDKMTGEQYLVALQGLKKVVEDHPSFE